MIIHDRSEEPTALWASGSSLLFVAALLSSSFLIFIFGALNLPGNSIITACYLLISLLGTVLLGYRIRETLPAAVSMDYVFAGFAGAVTLALAFGFSRSGYKEHVLLVINVLLGYAVGRLIDRVVLSEIRRRLFQISTVLVAAACVVTIPSLIGEIYARPFVFGFFHAATVFCIAFGYMTISFVYSDVNWRSRASLLLYLLIVIATTTFVASTVRFVILAVVLMIVFCFLRSILQRSLIWKKAALVLLSMVLGICAGTVSRYTQVVKISDHIAYSGSSSDMYGTNQNVVVLRSKPDREVSASLSSMPPSCNHAFDMNNSVAIRRALLGDAFFFLPKAGLFGYGLNSFSEISCIVGYQIHNSFLQTFVELGWAAGLLLLMLVAIPLRIFFIPGSAEVDVQFLLACIAFSCLLSMVYGQISRDLALFLFLGCFANLMAQRKSKFPTHE